MKKYCYDKLQQLNDHLNDLSCDKTMLFAEDAIEIAKKKLNEVKEFIIDRGFKDTNEEICFFKKIKPQFVAKLIYYNGIYKIEAKIPCGGEKATRKYLKNEITKLKRYFDNNLEFYRYYKTNSTYLDDKYFLRGKYDIKLSLDTYYFETDHSFCTSHDYKVAKILANDLIQLYIEDRIFRLSNILTTKNPQQSLNWTGSKAALVELIYALQAQGVLDHGHADIKQISRAFSRMLNIDLGDFYHTYLELRNRKINKTKFLDSLRDGLSKKMDEQDDRSENI